MTPSHPTKAGALRFAQVYRALLPFLSLAVVLLVFLLTDLFTNGGIQKFGEMMSPGNLMLVANQNVIVALGALGMTLVIINGGIDLSPGSSIALSTVVIALCLKSGFGSSAALLAGLGTGAAIGFLNGVIITRFKIVPFIATLGMMSIARGLAKVMSGEEKISITNVNPNPLTGAPQGDGGEDSKIWLTDMLYGEGIGPFSSGIVTLAVLAIALWAVLRYTVFGRYVFAIGSNETAARLCGLRVEGQKTLVYMLAGLFFGAAAIMEFSLLGNGDPSTAVGKELDIIAAVVIGGGSLSGGKGSVLGSLVGAYIISLLRNGCVLYDIPNPVQEIVTGVIIVAAVTIDQLLLRRRS